MKRYLYLFYLAILGPCLEAENLNDLSMSQMEFINFKERLITSVETHPEALLQDSLVSQKVYDLDIVKSRYRPNVSFISSSKTPINSQSDSFFQSIQRKQHSSINKSLVLEKLVTDFGQTKSLISQEEHNVSSTKALNLSEKSKLVLRALDACMDTAVYSLAYLANQSSVLRLEEISNLIKIRVDAGRAPGREESRANARLSEGKAREILTSSKLSESEARFKALLPSVSFCRKLPLAEFYIEMDFDRSVLTAKANNLEMQAFSFKLESLEDQVSIIKKDKFPKITAQVRADQFDITHSEDYELYGGFNLNWDIYQGERRLIQEKKANEEIRAANYQRTAFERELESLVASSLADLRNSEDRLKAFREAYKANEESSEQLKAQFFSANVSLLDLLQAERDLLDSIESLILNSKEVAMKKFIHLHYVGNLIREFNLKDE